MSWPFSDSSDWVVVDPPSSSSSSSSEDDSVSEVEVGSTLVLSGDGDGDDRRGRCLAETRSEDSLPLGVMGSLAARLSCG